MIIGSGLIAKKFAQYRDNDKYLFFASGISDSSNILDELFQREEALLKKILEEHSSKIFIYFSSCDIECTDSKGILYYQHKAKMEEIVKNSARIFHIFRLPQVVGEGGNNKTLMNFLVHSILEHNGFHLFKGTYKNILDIDDVYKICHYILQNGLYENKTINIINSIYFKTEDIIKSIENFSGSEAIFKIVENKASCKYTKIISQDILSKMKIDFNNHYIDKLLIKYYSSDKRDII